MRKIAALLALVVIVGCKDSKVAVDLQGIPPTTRSQRYQIVINSHPFDGNNTQAFLIDTERGRVWEYFPASTAGKERYSSHFSKTYIIDEEGLLGPTQGTFSKLHDAANQIGWEPQRGAKINE
jgi:hypothetical protein